METRRHGDKKLLSAGFFADAIPLCGGLYCWVAGSMAAVLPHPPWVAASLLTALSLSTVATVLAIRFGSGEDNPSNHAGLDDRRNPR